MRGSLSAQQVLVEEFVVLLGAEDVTRFAGGRINQLVRQHAAHQLARLSLVQVLGQRHVRHHGVMLHFVQLAQGFLPFI